MAGSLRHLPQQRGEVAQGVLAHQLVLAEHEAGVLHLGVAGGEVVVPEQRQLLLQRVRAVEHPVQPPGPQLHAVVGVGDAPGHLPADLIELLLPRPALKESFDRLLGAVLEAASSSAVVAPKAARRYRWPTRRRSHGALSEGRYGSHAQSGSDLLSAVSAIGVVLLIPRLSAIRRACPGGMNPPAR